MQAVCITANLWPTLPSNAIASVKQYVRPIERRFARPTGERSETFVCSRKRFVKRVQTTRIITLEAVQVCVFEVGDNNGDDVWTGDDDDDDDDEDDNNDDQEN